MLASFYCSCYHNTGKIPESISQLKNLTELHLNENSFSGKKLSWAIFYGPMHAARQLLMIHVYFSFQVAVNISWASHSCRQYRLLAFGVNLKIFQKRSLVRMFLCSRSWGICGTDSRPSLTYCCRRWIMERFKSLIVQRLRANVVKICPFG